MPINSNIWRAEYPTEGSCYDRSQPQLMGSYSERRLSDLIITEQEKDTKLDQCHHHLAELKLGENSNPIDQQVQEMADCLGDIQRVLDSRKRNELLAQGTKPENIICNETLWPTNCVWQAKYPTEGYCFDVNRPVSLGRAIQCSPVIPGVDEKQTKLDQCKQHLTQLQVPPSEFLTWDDCMNNKLRNEQRSLRESLLGTGGSPAIPESVTCSGTYGSSRGAGK